MSKKIAVILLNLGGPDSLESVKPFLFNLFYDRAIINLPNPFRWLLAKFISSRREKTAQEIYQFMGGKSPINQYTEEQRRALESVLNKNGDNYKVFYIMRYWHPMSEEVVKKLQKSDIEEVILLPLYPQFSTTTTGSSFDDFKKTAKDLGFNVPVKSVCCYFNNKDFLSAHIELLKKEMSKLSGDFTILFSAHGLPESVIRKGDPYQWQVEKTVEYLLQDLPKNTDHIICYQSKVGPLPWIGPNTEEVIEEVAKSGKGIIIVPIAFVSEHSETLVELDIEYKEIADKYNLRDYYRVPTLNAHKLYISSLKDIVDEALTKQEGEVSPFGGKKLCPSNFKQCRCK